MKTLRQILAVIAAGTVFTLPVGGAQPVVPSDGSDGALVITSNTVIDLSKAITGNWSDNNAANAGKGIYDPNKWAVVFKYSSVNIASGAGLSFANHPTHAPVVWLVSGDVSIAGDLVLDGSASEPGPGGFRGGGGRNDALGLPVGQGLGPGGGGYSGVYTSYGSPELLPLIGGSGSSAWSPNPGLGGGGAIFIASPGRITIDGRCLARGIFQGWPYNVASSGGAIRLQADIIEGTGQLDVGDGRLRLEANSIAPTLHSVSQANPISFQLPIQVQSPIWPAENAPTVRLVSVGGQAAPAQPLARWTYWDQDLKIATNTPIPILLETTHFPTNGTVNVFITPEHGARVTSLATYVSGTADLATWLVETSLPLRNSIIQARAVSP
jgi:hypothetical protein